MSVSDGSAKIYHLRRPSALRTYGWTLVGVPVYLLIIIAGPLPLKLLFGYLLIGDLLRLLPTFREGYAVLTRDELHVKNLTLIKIRYSRIRAVEPLPAQSIRARLIRIAGGGHPGDSRFRVALEKTVWLFMLFPVPIAFPTKELWLQFTNGAAFADELSERLDATADGCSG